MDKCPYCGAETRPGDNFCLNCGNRLLATPSYQQTSPAIGDATIPGSDNWSGPIGMPLAPVSDDRMVVEVPTILEDTSAPTVQATLDKIENPGRFIVRDDKGEMLQEYRLEKSETVIGRAPTSDILLAKDKLTSRRHAVVRYENGSYILYDERSANGTFVNGQQLEESTPRTLKEGDHVGIGEHELIFRSATSTGVEDLPTIAVPPEAVAKEITYRTREDEQMKAASSNEFSTRSMNGDGSVPVTPAPQPVAVAPTPQSAVASTADEATSMAPSQPMPMTAPPVPSSPSSPAPPPSSTSATPDTGATFSRLTSLAQPTLPDITQLIAALTTLDGQVSLLQEQLNNSQEAIRTHEVEIAQTTNQLRSGVRRVSERMDSTIADVARQREQAGWADLLQLMEDVMNNPRDIEYVTKLARKARELNKVFQIHQIVLNTLAECNSLLRSMIGDDRS
jgi:pSer/pThr/pTyr-binding forkhead associated (FHA) protein